MEKEIRTVTYAFLVILPFSVRSHPGEVPWRGPAYQIAWTQSKSKYRDRIQIYRTMT